MDKNILRETLAEAEHNQWIEWNKAIAKTKKINPERLARWKKLWGPYMELSEKDKESDRKYADRVMEILTTMGCFG